MNLKLSVLAPLLLALWLTPEARAEPYTYSYDQFGASIQQAASDVNGQSLATQPGFVQGEAFGQIYRPEPAHYPLQIRGVDLILAAPPLASGLTTHATIEIWNSTSAGPDPGTAGPFFQISTTDIFNPSTGADGVPLQGGVGLSVDFDLEDPEGHPSVITEGNIWVMIRMTSAAQSMENEWGTIACAIVFGLGCGCQNVGTINDFATTNEANVLNIVTPLGQCSGNTTWMYNEDAGVTGDYIIRMRADIAATTCEPDCEGLACGDDGCGGSCGTCGSNEVCTDGTCQTFCLPDCAGKSCGGDGCGGSCGTCGADETCEEGSCIDPSGCSPPCEGGQVCDEGTCVDPTGCSPPCEGGQVCEEGTCVDACAPDCDGKACGDDGCGGVCGTCEGNETCQDGVCGDGGTCSPVCEGGQICVDGVCVIDCAADCDGKTCGDDGCGGSCGSCAAADVCSGDGVCTSSPGGLEISDISPNSGLNDIAVSVAITGSGFVDGLEVIIAGQELAGVTVTGDSLIRGEVPAGLPVGPQTVTVANPDGTTATLTDAFTVIAAANGTCGDAVCDIAGGETTATCPSDCGVVQSSTSGCAADSGAQPWSFGLTLMGLAMALAAWRRSRRDTA